MAGNGEDFAPLLGGEARGDEAARASRRLDDEHAQRQAGDDAVASREVLAARGEAEGHFADEAAALADLALQVLVLGWIDVVEAAGEHGDGAGVDRRLVRHAVDAARQAGGDDEAGAADLVRELACQLGAGRRALSRPDDGDGRPLQKRDVALGVEQRRRRFERGQGRRILRLADEHELGAGALRALELRFRLMLRADADGAAKATALRQLRESGERCRGGAVVLQQVAKGDGTDVLGAGEPHCRDALGIG